jgi:hypothetical protein
MKAIDNLFNRVGDVTAERDRFRNALARIEYLAEEPDTRNGQNISYSLEVVEEIWSLARKTLAGEDV